MVSVLFNEPKLLKFNAADPIAALAAQIVSVLFNEPKLLKSTVLAFAADARRCFSALQRAEIAEIVTVDDPVPSSPTFQCSSTSRNC